MTEPLHQSQIHRCLKDMPRMSERAAFGENLPGASRVPVGIGGVPEEI